MKLIYLFFFLLIPLLGLAQMSNSRYSEPDYREILSPNTISQSVDPISPAISAEIEHLRYCLKNYRKEKLTGTWLTIGGGFIAGLATGLYQNDVIDENTAGIVYIGGGVMVITGYVMQITCNRWLKKASIGPADSGIGLKVKF